MTDSRVPRLTGRALCAGAVLFFLSASVLSPLLPLDLPEAETRLSTVYLLRISLACIAVTLLALGCVGVYTKLRPGALATAATLLAFCGSVWLAALEWTNLFILPALGRFDPEALDTVSGTPLATAGFTSAILVFSLGWLTLAILLLRIRELRAGALPLLIGLLATPALSAALGPWGGAVGGVALSAGWFLIGRRVGQAPGVASRT